MSTQDFDILPQKKQCPAGAHDYGSPNMRILVRNRSHLDVVCTVCGKGFWWLYAQPAEGEHLEVLEGDNGASNEWHTRQFAGAKKCKKEGCNCD